MKVTDLADKSGVDKNTISAYERGRTPKPDKLDAIARALHTTVAEIFNSVPQHSDPLTTAITRAYVNADARTQRIVRTALGLDDRPHVGHERRDDPPKDHLAPHSPRADHPHPHKR